MKAVFEFEMPESCGKCRLSMHIPELLCVVTDRNVSEYRDARHPKCPLKTAPDDKESARKLKTVWRAMEFLEKRELKIRERCIHSLDFFKADTMPAIEELKRYCGGENISKEGLKTRLDAVMNSITDFVFLGWITDE